MNKRSVRWVALGLMLAAGVAAYAQTNFFWTNTVDGAWATSVNWTNETGVGGGPIAGSNDYTISFINAGNTYIANNDFGDFSLNRLIFNNVAATLTGGTLTFSTLSDGITLPQLIQTGSSNVTIQSALVLATNTTFSISNTGRLTISGSISGSGGLTKSGASVLILAASNTYTGLTIIENSVANGTLILSNATGSGVAVAGNLQLGSGSANDVFLRLAANEQIADTAIVSFNTSGSPAYGRWDVLGFNETIGGLNDPNAHGIIEDSGNNASSDTNSGPGTLTINVSTATNYIFAGYIRDHGSAAGPSNTIAIIKTGIGTQTFSGPNIGGGGGITINNGALVLTNTTALPCGVLVNGGQLLLASATAINGKPITNNAPNGLGFLSTNAFTIGSLIGNASGGIALTNDTGAPVTLTIGSGNTAVNFAGNISGSGSLSKIGSGTLILSGNNSFGGLLTNSGTGAITLSGSNTFGGVTLTAGSLNINSPGALGPGTFTIAGGTLDNTSGAPLTNSQPTALNWNGNFTFTGTTNLHLGNGPVTLSATRTITVSSNTFTVGGVIGDTGGGFGLTKAGNGTLVLAGNSTYSGLTTVSAGTLLLAGGNNTLSTNAPLTISAGILDLGGSTQTTTGLVTLTSGIIQNGTLVNDVTNFAGLAGTISATLSGAAGLTKTTTGVLTLTSSNTFTGVTTVQAGQLIVSNNYALGSAAASTVVSNAAMLVLANGITVTGETVLLSGAGDSYGALRAAANSTGTWAGPVVLNDAANTPRFGGSTGAKLTISGPISNGSGSSLYISLTNGTVVISGTNNTYTGLTGIGRGTLQLGADNALPVTTTLDMEPLTPVTEFTIFDLNGHNQTVAQLKNSQTPTGGMTITNTGGALGTLTITQTVTSTYSGLIAGNVAVVKTGSGALALSGANTFGGGITLNAGTLNINNASALGTGTLVIAGGALDNTTAGAITNSRNNAMSWNGDFTAATTHSLNLGAGAVTLGSNRIVTVAANALTVGGVISDGGSNFGLTKAGNGTLVLTTNATYTGATIINTGTLQLAGGLNPLSPYSAIIPNAGILDLGGGTQFSTGAVAFTSGGGTIQNGTLSNDTAYTAQGGTIGISLAGAAGLTKTTTNALILSGSNTFSGGVTLNNGTLNINNGSALGTGVFTINGGVLDNTTAAALTNSQNNTQNWSSDFTFAGTRNLHLGTGAVTLGGGRIVTVSNNVLTIGGVISDGGSNFGLTKAGNGTLVLTTNATYTGATTINAGTLQLAGGLNPLSPFSTIFPNAGILDLGGGTQFSTGAIAFVGGTITNGSLSNNTAYTAQSGTISINLSGSAGLTKNGVGTLVLAGTNTYSGGTLLNAGVLQINSTNSLPVGIGNMTLSYGTTFAAGYQMGQSFLDRVSTASSGTVALAVSSTNALNFNTAGLTNVSLGAVGTVTNSGTLTPFGSAYRLGGGGGTLVITNALTDANNRLVAFSGGSGGTLQLSGVNTYSNTLILGGTVSFNADTALGNTAGASNIVMNGGTLNLSGVAMSLTRGIAIGTNGGTFTTTSGNLTLAGVIRNLPGQTGTVTIAGGNIVVVNNSSTYSGNTVLTGTVLVVVSKDSVGSGTNVTSGPFGIGTLVFAGAQIRNTTSGSGFTIGNNILFAADTTAPSAAGARNLTFSGEVTLTGTRMFTQAETSTITFSGPIGDNGLGYGFTKAGTGLLVLSGTNTYTGPTTISNGTLKVAFGGSLSSSTRVYVDPLGLLDLDGNSQTIAGLTGGGVVTNGGGNLTLNLASPNTFGGILKGASSLTLTGGGTLIMTGTNSFGSASVISNGSTYVVNGLHNGALITAYAGSTVGGNGPISGTLLVNGGIYQPGYGGVLTQTVATLTLTNSGTLAVTLAQTNNPAYVTVSSQLALAGTNNYLRLSNPDSLSFTAGTITLVDYHGTGVLDYTNNYFRLADNINTIVGPNDGWALTNNMQFSVVGGSSSVTNLFTINYDDLANGVITLTAVPEPGTASLLGLVGLAFLVRRLRHRGKA